MKVILNMDLKYKKKWKGVALNDYILGACAQYRVKMPDLGMDKVYGHKRELYVSSEMYYFGIGSGQLASGLLREAFQEFFHCSHTSTVMSDLQGDRWLVALVDD